MKALSAAASAIRGALRAAQGDLDQIRTRIDELRAEQKRIRIAPRARTEVERFVDEMIAEAQAKGPFELGSLWSIYSAPHEALGSFARNDLFTVLAGWDAAKLKQLILAYAPEGITEAAREKAVARIEDDILRAEIEEEIACRALEAETGVTTMRRLGDINLAVVLAPDAELSSWR